MRRQAYVNSPFLTEITQLILPSQWISFSGTKSSKKYVPAVDLYNLCHQLYQKPCRSQSQYVCDALKKAPLASAYDVRGSFGQLVNTNPPNPITQPSVSIYRGGSPNPGQELSWVRTPTPNSVGLIQPRGSVHPCVII